MLSLPNEAAVLDKIVPWAAGDNRVRAMILTSSRTRPAGPVDLLSDYDVIGAVEDPKAFVEDEGWVGAYGSLMVRWGDEGELFGMKTYFRGDIYEDGIKIDWSIWDIALLRRIGEEEKLPDQLDVGYRVLLDKDGLTSSWKPPTYRAHIPEKPTEAQYIALIEEFWWSSTYVAKSLWRDEIMFAKWILDHDLKQETLRPFLEWQIEIEHDWSVKPGVLGRGLKQLLPAEIWQELEAIYVGAGLEETWNALFRTCDLFQRVAIDIGQTFGYEYPHKVDAQVRAYLQRIKSTPR
jgi:aminoglycoside 6-adenylyltransferase